MDTPEGKTGQLSKSPPRNSTTTDMCLAESDYISIEALNNEDPSFVSKRTGREDAQNYVSKQGFKLHPIFPTPSAQLLTTQHPNKLTASTSYEQQRVEIASTRAARLQRWGSLAFRVDHFSSVLVAFQQISKGKHLPDGFDLRGKHTWEEVFEAASAAEAKANADGSKNLFRRSGRGIQNYALAMSRVVDLIPGGDYTSALCGGLKIAFSVASQMKEKREAIVETFHQIPKILKEAADRLEEYSDDERLFEE
ncbi:MAG: hypothetical protein Q9226_005965, partial [Calogaya cf. arnoldii]